MRESENGPRIEELRRAALPLNNRADLDPLIAAIGDAQYILLGEASHGTHEFYTWRTEITRRLILEKRASFIAVEGDWPDCYRVNRYIKGLPDCDRSARDALHAFARWPTWMWANQEVVTLAEWLRDHNRSTRTEEQVGFYGLDVYSLWESMEAVVRYLEGVDPEFARSARRAYMCFEPFNKDAQQYARAAMFAPSSCRDAAVSVLKDLRANAPQYLQDGRQAYYNAEQNALVAQEAEKYYRAMVHGGPQSWNVRDRHMTQTLERLMAYHGTAAKGIVWAHNTHVGDARYTDMAADGMVNLGQLVRESHPQPGAVAVVGFGTRAGHVIAAREWGAPMRAMRVPAARRSSIEDLLHRCGAQSAADRDAPRHDLQLLFDGSDDGGIAGLDQPVDHRAIGVVYNARNEHWGNYVPTLLARRYDAFLFIEHSRALEPLHIAARHDADAPETYPSGM